MAENIISRLQVDGNLDSPGEVIGHEHIVSPPATLHRHIKQASSADLEEVQLLLIDILAVAGALGEVVNDRTLVGLGPCVPLQGDLVTRLDGDMALSRLRVPVADDVGVTELSGLNVAIVCGTIGPADNRIMVGIPWMSQSKATAGQFQASSYKTWKAHRSLDKPHRCAQANPHVRERQH